MSSHLLTAVVFAVCLMLAVAAAAFMLTHRDDEY